MHDDVALGESGHDCGDGLAQVRVGPVGVQQVRHGQLDSSRVVPLVQQAQLPGGELDVGSDNDEPAPGIRVRTEGLLAGQRFPRLLTDAAAHERRADPVQQPGTATLRLGQAER